MPLQYLGIFSNAARMFEEGWSKGLREEVRQELIGDYLDQAEHLKSETNGHIAAAMLAGAVLENKLRKLCDAHIPPIVYDADRSTLNFLTQELYKNGAINQTEMKQLTAIAAVRNNAAHGKFEAVKLADVQDIVARIRRFVNEH